MLVNNTIHYGGHAGEDPDDVEGLLFLGLHRRYKNHTVWEEAHSPRTDYEMLSSAH